jgi:hypothetical protein
MLRYDCRHARTPKNPLNGWLLMTAYGLDLMVSLL